MKTSRERQVYELYDRLADLTAPARAAGIAEADLTDDERARVRALLDVFDRDTSRRSGTSMEYVSMRVDSDPLADPLIGEPVGAYRLLERIATEGGMGTVYRAERADGQYRQPVAIKVLRRGLDTDRFVQRFARERQILAGLKHPSIVHLVDAGSTVDGRPFFAMELVESGLPLDEHAREHNLSIADRVALFLRVCAAVEHAHRNLVVHRDLKPTNVLITPDGEPKLLDFGLAKLLGTDVDGMEDLTRPDERFMTPQYASPEQVRGERVLPASDIYALGVMLYELLAGQRPYTFSSTAPAEIERVVCEAPIRRPSAIVDQRVRRQLEGDLDAIVLKALRKEPEGRYGSVEAFSQDLRRHLLGLPVTAHAGSAAYRTRKFAWRNRRMLTAAAAVAAVLVAGVIATAWQGRAAARARDDANAQRRIAEQRFDDVRRLATGFVFDFHDAIANLAGATAARQMVLTKGAEYLDILSRSAVGNRSLQLELAEAYDRIGDIQSNPFGSNLGNVRAGLANYDKAAAIRKALVTDGDVGTDLDLAYSKGLERTAEGLFANGRVADGLTVLQQAEARYARALAAGSGSRAAQLGMARSLNRLCVLRLPSGDASGAVDACRRSQAAFAVVTAQHPDDAALAEAAAMNDAAHANALRITGNPGEALALQQRATGRLSALIEAHPDNATTRQNLATVLVQYASSLAAQERQQEARGAYAQAVEALDALRRADPVNERVRSVLSFVLLRRGPTLIAAGYVGEARASTSRGLALLRDQAQRPEAGPTDKNEYASWLLTCEPADARRPAEALRFAQQAVAAAPTPVYLDTLALAYFATGDRQRAIETGDRALAALPALKAGEKPTGLRAEIERHLASFKAPARG